MVRRHFAEAIPWFERSLSVFLQESAELYVAMIRSELGCCHLELGDHERALQLFEEAARVDLAAGALRGYEINLANIGNVYLLRGEYPKAISHYQQAVAIARELSDWISTAKWLQNLKITFEQMGNYELAREYEREADSASQTVEAMREQARRELSPST